MVAVFSVVGLSLALIRLPPLLLAGTSLAAPCGCLLSSPPRLLSFFLGGVNSSTSLAPSCIFFAIASSHLSSVVSSKGLSVIAQTFCPLSSRNVAKLASSFPACPCMVHPTMTGSNRQHSSTHLAESQDATTWKPRKQERSTYSHQNRDQRTHIQCTWSWTESVQEKPQHGSAHPVLRPFLLRVDAKDDARVAFVCPLEMGQQLVPTSRASSQFLFFCTVLLLNLQRNQRCKLRRQISKLIAARHGNEGRNEAQTGATRNQGTQTWRASKPQKTRKQETRQAERVWNKTSAVAFARERKTVNVSWLGRPCALHTIGCRRCCDGVKKGEGHLDGVQPVPACWACGEQIEMPSAV